MYTFACLLKLFIFPKYTPDHFRTIKYIGQKTPSSGITDTGIDIGINLIIKLSSVSFHKVRAKCVVL